MKRLRTLFLALGLAVVLSVGVANATSYNLANLVGGQSFVLGDKTFADWTFAPPTGFAAGQFTVTTLSASPGLVSIVINGPFEADSGEKNDFLLFYSVATVSGAPTITDVHQAFNLSGGGGEITIGETVWDQGFFTGNAIANSTVAWNINFNDKIDPPGEAIQGDILVFDPIKKVYVTKDILIESQLVGRDQQGNPIYGDLGATTIAQGFSQSQVPEPATMLLLGSGLVGLAGFARRKLSKK